MNNKKQSRFDVQVVIDPNISFARKAAAAAAIATHDMMNQTAPLILTQQNQPQQQQNKQAGCRIVHQPQFQPVQSNKASKNKKLKKNQNNKQYQEDGEIVYKLPSLSKCLENQILPKNSQMLKQYCEIASKHNMYIKTHFQEFMKSNNTNLQAKNPQSQQPPNQYNKKDQHYSQSPIGSRYTDIFGSGQALGQQSTRQVKNIVIPTEEGLSQLDQSKLASTYNRQSLLQSVLTSKNASKKAIQCNMTTPNATMLKDDQYKHVDSEIAIKDLKPAAEIEAKEYQNQVVYNNEAYINYPEVREQARSPDRVSLRLSLPATPKNIDINWSSYNILTKQKTNIQQDSGDINSNANANSNNNNPSSSQRRRIFSANNTIQQDPTFRGGGPIQAIQETKLNDQIGSEFSYRSDQNSITTQLEFQCAQVQTQNQDLISLSSNPRVANQKTQQKTFKEQFKPMKAIKLNNYSFRNAFQHQIDRTKSKSNNKTGKGTGQHSLSKSLQFQKQALTGLTELNKTNQEDTTNKIYLEERNSKKHKEKKQNEIEGAKQRVRGANQEDSTSIAINEKSSKSLLSTRQMRLQKLKQSGRQLNEYALQQEKNKMIHLKHQAEQKLLLQLYKQNQTTNQQSNYYTQDVFNIRFMNNGDIGSQQNLPQIEIEMLSEEGNQSNSKTMNDERVSSNLKQNQTSPLNMTPQEKEQADLQQKVLDSFYKNNMKVLVNKPLQNDFKDVTSGQTYFTGGSLTNKNKDQQTSFRFLPLAITNVNVCSNGTLGLSQISEAALDAASVAHDESTSQNPDSIHYVRGPTYSNKKLQLWQISKQIPSSQMSYSPSIGEGYLLNQMLSHAQTSEDLVSSTQQELINNELAHSSTNVLQENDIKLNIAPHVQRKVTTIKSRRREKAVDPAPIDATTMMPYGTRQPIQSVYKHESAARQLGLINEMTLTKTQGVNFRNGENTRFKLNNRTEEIYKTLNILDLYEYQDADKKWEDEQEQRNLTKRFLPGKFELLKQTQPLVSPAGKFKRLQSAKAGSSRGLGIKHLKHKEVQDMKLLPQTQPTAVLSHRNKQLQQQQQSQPKHILKDQFLMQYCIGVSPKHYKMDVPLINQKLFNYLSQTDIPQNESKSGANSTRSVNIQTQGESYLQKVLFPNGTPPAFELQEPLTSSNKGTASNKHREVIYMPIQSQIPKIDINFGGSGQNTYQKKNTNNMFNTHEISKQTSCYNMGTNYSFSKMTEDQQQQQYQQQQQIQMQNNQNQYNFMKSNNGRKLRPHHNQNNINISPTKDKQAFLNNSTTQINDLVNNSSAALHYLQNSQTSVTPAILSSLNGANNAKSILVSNPSQYKPRPQSYSPVAHIKQHQRSFSQMPPLDVQQQDNLVGSGDKIHESTQQYMNQQLLSFGNNVDNLMKTALLSAGGGTQQTSLAHPLQLDVIGGRVKLNQSPPCKPSLHLKNESLLLHQVSPTNLQIQEYIRQFEQQELAAHSPQFQVENDDAPLRNIVHQNKARAITLANMGVLMMDPACSVLNSQQMSHRRQSTGQFNDSVVGVLDNIYNSGAMYTMSGAQSSAGGGAGGGGIGTERLERENQNIDERQS